VPAATRIGKPLAIAAALLFAAFVVANGVPTLRHDWTWPIDRAAIAPFLGEATSGWLSTGFGTPNPHPTTYLIAIPIVFFMWLFGPLAGLAALSVAIGYLCMRVADAAAARWNGPPAGALGLGLFALFNPWVYNEVVAGHLVMVLAYGGAIGLIAEMLRGREASSVRLALWIALIEAQLQFYLVAMLALVVFAAATKKWLPPLLGLLFGMPSVIGLVAERSALLRIPYGMTWQTNQSVAPPALLGLGGYFPGYADRLGITASIAVWLVLALALLGAVAARRSRATAWALGAAVALYVVILGVNGPLAGAYAWTVRNVPESGVFRELYDLAGLFAALALALACAATARFKRLGYVALAAGVALAVTWMVHPPSDLWVGARSYPHPVVAAPPFSRVALLPAFQPLGLRDGSGDGADPDARAYPGHVATLNEYYPTYPVDMALARYEQEGDVAALRALGVVEIVGRPWMASRSRGGIGLAATSLRPTEPRAAPVAVRYLPGATPLISECDRPRVVAFDDGENACDIFFGDTGGYAPLRPVTGDADEIDPGRSWIDARLAFAESPALAQPFGGALTQSRVPHRVEPGSWLLAYVRGRLTGGGRTLLASGGSFEWLRIAPGVTSVACDGLCELVAQTASLPNLPRALAPAPAKALAFHRFAPWMYVVEREADSAALLRLNERYDAAWIAIAAWRVLPHVRVGAGANGWFFAEPASRVILIQMSSLLQSIAEALGVLCAIGLLKALANAPTKRA